MPKLSDILGGWALPSMANAVKNDERAREALDAVEQLKAFAAATGGKVTIS